MNGPSSSEQGSRDLRFWIFLLMLIGSAVCVRTAAADGVVDGRLRLTVVPQFGAFRGQAPLPLSVTLSWSNSALIEGRLQLRWYVRQELLGTYLSPELALVESSVTRSILFPPVIMPDDNAVFSVQGEFHTADQIYDLDIHDLTVPLDWRRTFVVGLCREPPLQMETPAIEADDPTHVGLIESLRLEAFIEKRLTNRELSTLVVEVDPADVPTNPLQLLGFDIFVIPGESIGELTQRSLDTIVTWVEAGGSLCCLVDTPLPESYVAFLNRLVAEDPGYAVYLQSEGGRLLPIEGDMRGSDHHRCGLGRLVVVRGEVEYGSEDWARALLFLWRVREDRIADWQRGKPWPMMTRLRPNEYVPLLTLEPERPWSITPMTNLLLPETVKGLPLIAVCGILVTFLLVIAPGDYFLLGWLRRRRWTWILFPAMSLLFTWLTMWLAERHLGGENLGRSITIVDVARDGRPLRTTRVDLLYSASSRHDAAEQQGTLMVPVDPKTSETGASRFSTPGVPRYDPPWVYSGVLPGRHVVHRDVQQWSPRLARTTRLGPAEFADESPLAGFDWRTVTWQQVADEQGCEALRDALRSRDPSAELMVVDGRELRYPSSPSDAMANATLVFVDSCSRSAGSRLFDLVSRISPTAAGQWEDLILLDPSAADERLVIVATEVAEGQYVVYRLLLKKEE